MKKNVALFSLAAGFLACLLIVGCEREAMATDSLPVPATDLKPPAPGEPNRVAIFAGGCFWCIESVFEQLNGVSDVVSGYAGGTAEDANYATVSSGATKHAECVRIVYDPSKITYGQLLRVFFTVHDPTTLNAQGPDHGRQYRSAVFFQSDEQKAVAEAYIKQLNDAHAFKDPIVTTVEPLGDGFFKAEDYHQNYTKENPESRYIQSFAIPKIAKTRSHFPGQLKGAAEPSTQPTTNPTP